MKWGEGWHPGPDVCCVFLVRCPRNTPQSGLASAPQSHSGPEQVGLQTALVTTAVQARLAWQRVGAPKLQMSFNFRTGRLDWKCVINHHRPSPPVAIHHDLFRRYWWQRQIGAN